MEQKLRANSNLLAMAQLGEVMEFSLLANQINIGNVLSTFWMVHAVCVRVLRKCLSAGWLWGKWMVTSNLAFGIVF